MASDTILAAENLSVYRDSDRGRLTVARDLSLKLAAGDIAVLTGPSGSGKTSILWALARLIPISGGTLYCRGVEASQIPATRWRTQIGLLQQQPVMMTGTIGDNIVLPFRLRERRRTHTSPPSTETMSKALAAVGLEQISLDGSASELSTGQAARVSFVRLALSGADCLLLDEPAASLDSDCRALIRSQIQHLAAQGKAVLVVDHSGALADIGRGLILSEGQMRESQ